MSVTYSSDPDEVRRSAVVAAQTWRDTAARDLAGVYDLGDEMAAFVLSLSENQPS